MEKKKAVAKKRPEAPPEDAAQKEAPVAKKEGQPAEKKHAGSEQRPARITTSLTEKTEEELVDLTSRVYKLVVERGKDGVLQ
ncbi:MAG TPA: hypothetical protein VLY65_00995, partial [Nitrososphaerales archaeon]|nr:hypothetical protein [Nitrososphaerales archaeon]